MHSPPLIHARSDCLPRTLHIVVIQKSTMWSLRHSHTCELIHFVMYSPKSPRYYPTYHGSPSPHRHDYSDTGSEIYVDQTYHGINQPPPPPPPPRVSRANVPVVPSTPRAITPIGRPNTTTPSEYSSVSKTKNKRKGGVVIETMSAPNPCCKGFFGEFFLNWNFEIYLIWVFLIWVLQVRTLGEFAAFCYSWDLIDWTFYILICTCGGMCSYAWVCLFCRWTWVCCWSRSDSVSCFSFLTRHLCGEYNAHLDLYKL